MVSPEARADGAAARVYRLHFSGQGREYFGIWVVNVLLTLATLGIYSAWVKVRRLQYFHRHTSLAGASFDYHGNPVAILKGRLIALGLVLAYNGAALVGVKATMAVLVVLADR